MTRILPIQEKTLRSCLVALRTCINLLPDAHPESAACLEAASEVALILATMASVEEEIAVRVLA